MKAIKMKIGLLLCITLLCSLVSNAQSDKKDKAENAIGGICHR